VFPKPIATTRSATGIPTGRLAVWWVLASEVVIFGGLLASYLMHRLGHPEWANAAAVTNTWIGAFNTLVLLSSSFTAVGTSPFSFCSPSRGPTSTMRTCLGRLMRPPCGAILRLRPPARPP